MKSRISKDLLTAGQEGIRSQMNNLVIDSVVAVAGPDMDISVVANLTEGDRVLAEMNGTRVYSENNCPLLAGIPWTVVSNNPPPVRRNPTAEHTLVISHPQMADITLSYTNLLILGGSRQPAVFCESNISAGPVYVVLQFVSHYLRPDYATKEFESYDHEQARLIWDNPKYREVALKALRLTLGGLSKGWGCKGINRMAIRSHVPVLTLRNFLRSGDLDQKSFDALHATIHWLPYFMEQSGYTTMRAGSDSQQSR